MQWKETMLSDYFCFHFKFLHPFAIFLLFSSYTHTEHIDSHKQICLHVAHKFSNKALQLYAFEGSQYGYSFVYLKGKWVENQTIWKTLNSLFKTSVNEKTC